MSAYRILLKKVKRGLGDINSLYQYYLTESKEMVEGKTGNYEIFETENLSELSSTVSDLIEEYGVNNVKPVLNLTTDYEINIIDFEILNTVNIEINGESININFYNENSNIDIPKLKKGTNTVKLITNREGYNFKFNGDVLEPDKLYNFQVESITDTSKIEVAYSNDSITKKVYINTLNSKLVNLIASGQTINSKNEFYLSFVDKTQIIKLDSKGNIIFYYCLDTKEYKGFIDFKKHMIKGIPYYSYFRIYTVYSGLKFTDFLAGERVILDSDYNEIDIVKFARSNLVNENTPMDGHDFIMLDIGHYICSTFIMKKVNNIPNMAMTDYSNGINVVASYVQEQLKGNVIWEFDSTNESDLYIMSKSVFDTTCNSYNSTSSYHNYCFVNGFKIINDNLIALSCKNLSSILLVSRNDGTIGFKIGDNLREDTWSEYFDNFNIPNQEKFVNQIDFDLSIVENNIMIIDVLSANISNIEDIKFTSSTFKINLRNMSYEPLYSFSKECQIYKYGNYRIYDRINFYACCSFIEKYTTSISKSIGSINDISQGGVELFEIETDEDVTPYKCYFL